jgi:hypothetical protein
MAFEAFRQTYGEPAAGSAGPPHTKLPHVLEPLAGTDLPGVYADGFISVLSAREGDGALGGWSAHLPPGATLFGSSAFGALFVATDEELYIVDTQYGQVIEAEPDIADFLEIATGPDAREDIFREALFRQWLEIHEPLPPADVLAPTPYLPLGGSWALETLKPVKLAVYLGLTGQLFGPGTGLEIDYR